MEALRNAGGRVSRDPRDARAICAQADFLRPYDLIERILTRHDGRRRLLARLGPRPRTGIDALLSQALAYDAGGTPSLTGFLAWMEPTIEIKRQMDSAATASG